MDVLVPVGLAAMFIILFLWGIFKGRFFLIVFELSTSLAIAYLIYLAGYSTIAAYGATLFAGFFVFYMNKVLK